MVAFRSCIDATTAKLGQAVVRDLLRDERGGNDARHLSPRGEHSVRDGSHEADTGTAIHQTDSACRQRSAKLRSVPPVLRTRARTRASEDADALRPICLPRTPTCASMSDERPAKRGNGSNVVGNRDGVIKRIPVPYSPNISAMNSTVIVAVPILGRPRPSLPPFRSR